MVQNLLRIRLTNIDEGQPILMMRPKLRGCPSVCSRTGLSARLARDARWLLSHAIPPFSAQEESPELSSAPELDRPPCDRRGAIAPRADLEELAEAPFFSAALIFLEFTHSSSP